MSNPTPLLIGTDQGFADTVSSNWSDAKAAVQAVLDLYTATGLSALTTDDFASLFNDTDSLLYDKITGGSLAIGSVALDKKQALNIVAKPTGYAALIAGISQLGVRAKEGWGIKSQGGASFTLESISACFTLDGSGVLQYSTQINNIITNAGKKYLNTSKGQAVYNFIEDMKTSFFANGLDTYFSEPDKIARIAEEAIKSIDKTNSTFLIDYEGISKSFDR